MGEEYIDTTSEQEWMDGYYYPVLPKYNSIGKFIGGNYPNDNTPFPQNGPITRENMVDENLKISIGTKILDSNIFEDESGNNNRAFVFDDYRPNFDSVTLEPKKVKRFNKIKKSRYKRGF